MHLFWSQGNEATHQHSSGTTQDRLSLSLSASPSPYLVGVFPGFGVAVLVFLHVSHGCRHSFWTPHSGRQKPEAYRSRHLRKTCEPRDRSGGDVCRFFAERRAVEDADALAFLVGRARPPLLTAAFICGCPVLGFRARSNIWSPLWPEEKCMLVVDWWLWAERRGWGGGERRDGRRPTRGEQRRNTQDVHKIAMVAEENTI